MPVYGIVTRYPKSHEEVWVTQAFDSLEDPEGGFLYEFSEANAWMQPIMTRKDMEFFLSRPKDYHVNNVVNRPSRPQRPISFEDGSQKPIDGSALMAEQRIPTPEPKPTQLPGPAAEFPKRRTGRPPKIQAPTLS
mgnify:CR=1 FL=1